MNNPFREVRETFSIPPPVAILDIEKFPNFPPASTSSAEWFADVLRLAGAHVVRSKGGWAAQCPAHEDASPSLSIGTGREGQLLIRCHSGCKVAAVLDAVNCTATHLSTVSPLTPEQHVAAMPSVVSFPVVKHTGGAGGRLDPAVWLVHSEHRYGERWLLARFRHRLTGEKAPRWFTRAGERWVPGRLDVPAGGLPAYRAPEVVASSGAVLVVESESSVDAAWTAGMPATTWAGGASDVRNFRDCLRAVTWRRDVVLCPDNDAPGRRAVKALQKHLDGFVLSVRVVDPRDFLPDCPKGGDARDVIEQMGVDVFRGGQLWRRPLPPAPEPQPEPEPTPPPMVSIDPMVPIVRVERARTEFAPCEACGSTPLSGVLHDGECCNCAHLCECGHTLGGHLGDKSRACAACSCRSYRETYLGPESPYTELLRQHRAAVG